MTNGTPAERSHRKIKFILDYFGYKSFLNKSILDLGSGDGEIAASFYRIGAQVSCVDARENVCNLIKKKYPSIKVHQVDLDKNWPFDKFDVVFSLDLLCHLKNGESHLRNICASASKYLIIETAVCDYEDSNHAQVLLSSKILQDQSFNGYSFRPTSTFVERILKEYGFEFKRADYSSLNLGSLIYDWRPGSNSGICDINKRRFWLAKKVAHISNQKSNDEKIPFDRKISTYNALIPKPPPTVNPYNQSFKQFSPTSSAFSDSDSVRSLTKDCAIIQAEKFETPTASNLSGVILPLTPSSKMWYKKISPFFKNLKLHSSDKTMFGFDKTNNSPNVIICGVNNLQQGKKIFIEEFNQRLSEEQINILRQCETILTPSLLNFQQIIEAIPGTNLKRINKFWPMLNNKPNNQNYHVYFEKDARITKTLLKAWNPGLGHLVVVNSSFGLPDFARYVSDCEEYPVIFKLLNEAQSLIDISDNTYYSSGLIALAKGLGLPVISNNQFSLHEGNHTLISQVSEIPTFVEIKEALTKADYNRGDVDINYHNKFMTSIEELIKC